MDRVGLGVAQPMGGMNGSGSHRRWIAALAAFVTPGLILATSATATTLYKPQFAAKAPPTLGVAMRKAPGDRGLWVRGFSSGLRGQAVREGATDFERAGYSLGKDVAGGSTDLSPFERGWIAGTLQGTANRSTPRPDGSFLTRGQRISKLTPQRHNGPELPDGHSPSSDGKLVPERHNGPELPPGRAPVGETLPPVGDNEDPTHTDTNYSNSDGGSNAGLMVGLGAVAAALVLFAVLNKDDDEDPEYADGYRNAVQAAQGQDSWSPGEAPRSNPQTYVPGTHGGHKNWEQAADSWQRDEAARIARARCVQGLHEMLDGMADLEAGLAMQTAEASALVGQTGELSRAAVLLSEAAAKIKCGAAKMGVRSNYNLPGMKAARCDADSTARKLAARLASGELRMPSAAAMEKLPGAWQRLMDELGPAAILAKEVMRVLRCRVSGGSCSLKFSTEEEFVITLAHGSTRKIDIGEVCGGNPNALIDRVGRPFGVGPRFQQPLDTCATSPYGLRNRGMHHGTDLRGATGTPFKAVAPGKVIHSGRKGGYGNAVVIEHADGSQSIYGHIVDGGLLVRKGDTVDYETDIARIGSTGRSTGPHLHVEIRLRQPNGSLKTVNPEAYFGRIPRC